MNVLLGSASVESATAGQIRKIISQKTVRVEYDPNDIRVMGDTINEIRVAALASGKWVIDTHNGVPTPDFLLSTTLPTTQRNLYVEAYDIVSKKAQAGSVITTYVDAHVVMNDGTDHYVRMLQNEVDEFNKTHTVPPAADITQNLINSAGPLKKLNDKLDIASGFTPVPIATKVESSDAEMAVAKNKKMMTVAFVAVVAFLVMKGH